MDETVDQISVVMPYYSRQAVLRETLGTYRELYSSDVEIIIVDDGSPEPLGTIDGAKVIRLPYKTVGLSPVIPINIGIEYAAHDLIAISLPEVRHQSPVLYSMREVCEEDTYVMSRCWCDGTSRWLSAPDVEPPEGQQHHKPVGVGFNFCVMFRRQLWSKIGGMSREYRNGSHFDDTDFAHKIKKSGAALRWVDDVVIHSRRDGARAPWVPGGWAVNHAIFASKWL